MLGLKETDWGAINRQGSKKFLDSLRGFKLRKNHKECSKFDAFIKKKTLDQMKAFGDVPVQLMQWALAVRNYYVVLASANEPSASVKSSARANEKPRNATVVINLGFPDNAPNEEGEEAKD